MLLATSDRRDRPPSTNYQSELSSYNLVAGYKGFFLALCKVDNYNGSV